MKCPFCGFEDTLVLDTRESEEKTQVRRRRKCQGCNKRFVTLEAPVLNLPLVRKAGGERQAFEVEKLRTSLLRALHKRPVASSAVDAAVERIVQALLQVGEKEVDSRIVGEFAMAELRALDEVAYIRFASVYRRFSDIQDFHEAICDLRH